MELGTFIFENNEMDLGEAAEAYKRYPAAKTAFEAKLTEYRKAVAGLANLNPGSITNDEIKNVDLLAEEMEQLQKDSQFMQTIISNKLESLIHENEVLERDLTSHAGFLQDDEVEFSRALHEEAIKLMDNEELLSAVEKAYHAGECLIGLLTEAKKMWIERHQKNAEELKIKNKEEGITL